MKYGEHRFVYTVLSLNESTQPAFLQRWSRAFLSLTPEEDPGLCSGAMLHENQSIPPTQVSLDLHTLNVSLGRHFTLW